LQAINWSQAGWARGGEWWFVIADSHGRGWQRMRKGDDDGSIDSYSEIRKKFDKPFKSVDKITNTN